MFPRVALLALSFAAVAFGQQAGTSTAETHPSLPWQKCTKSGGCTTVSSGKITLDANWRWLHTTSGYTNCYTGNEWDTSLCPDGKTCAANCALDGADYSGTYGITTSGNALTLKFVTQSAQKNVGSRVYLMKDDTHYEIFKLLNQEFTFDVDVSNLPCGLNGALYFSEMEADGGMAANSGNKAGAKYGTGYCDSQCPRDIKFINGEANVEGWTGSPNDVNAGTGNWGACCNEMDIWEANSISAAYTPHPCTKSGLYRCSGTECGINDRYGTVCDPDGCDFNSFRMGDKSFYGKGLTVDTSRKFTVVTQFITDNGSSSGTLSEIRRLYVQDGKVIQNSKVNVAGMDAYDSITAGFCDAQKEAFGDTKSFQNHGGMAGMSASMARGMVLVLSVWDDHAANMLWLDSNYPTDADASKPGIARGTCPTTSGVPSDVESSAANSSVTFSNIRFGDIDSTYTGSGSTDTVSPPTGTTTSSTAVQTKWGQCGGQGWTGPTQCVAGSTCQVINNWYSQCSISCKHRRACMDEVWPIDPTLQRRGENRKKEREYGNRQSIWRQYERRTLMGEESTPKKNIVNDDDTVHDVEVTQGDDQHLTTTKITLMATETQTHPVIQRPLRGSRISTFYPVKSLPALSSLDSAFQLQEYISLLIRLDVHDVETITSLPGTNKDAKGKESKEGGDKEAKSGGEESKDDEVEKEKEEKEVTVDEACWIYEQLRRLAQDLTHPLITTLQQECSRTTCPEMKAGEWLYLCVAHGNEGSMEQCCAIDYILHTLDSATALLNSPRAFPSRLQIPVSSHRHFSSLARRLGRIFAHAYFHHREAFEQAEAESSLYARFLALTSKFDLVPSEFLVIPTTPDDDDDDEHNRDSGFGLKEVKLGTSYDPRRGLGHLLQQHQLPSSFQDDFPDVPRTRRVPHQQQQQQQQPSHGIQTQMQPGPSGMESPKKLGRNRTHTMVLSEAVGVVDDLARASTAAKAEEERQKQEQEEQEAKERERQAREREQIEAEAEAREDAKAEAEKAEQIAKEEAERVPTQDSGEPEAGVEASEDRPADGPKAEEGHPANNVTARTDTDASAETATIEEIETAGEVRDDYKEVVSTTNNDQPEEEKAESKVSGEESRDGKGEESKGEEETKEAAEAVSSGDGAEPQEGVEEKRVDTASEAA